MATDPRARMRELAAEAIAAGAPTSWFETLYREAGDDPTTVPWVDLAPNPLFIAWFDRERPTPRRALIIGCGAGDDAAFLARQGWQVTAFDIAPTAIAWSRARFPDLAIDWQVADATNMPAAWHGAFDLVVEIYTLQTLPPALRPAVLVGAAGTLAPGGTLLAICRGRDADAPEGVLPWKLARPDVTAPLADLLDLVAFEDLLDGEDPPQRRFRISWRRPNLEATA